MLKCQSSVPGSRLKLSGCCCAVEESGERMAVLTTLVGLLLIKHEDMEGDGGTGSLEDDVQILEVSSTSTRPVWVCVQSLEPGCDLGPQPA